MGYTLAIWKTCFQSTEKKAVILSNSSVSILSCILKDKMSRVWLCRQEYSIVEFYLNISHTRFFTPLYSFNIGLVIYCLEYCYNTISTKQSSGFVHLQFSTSPAARVHKVQLLERVIVITSQISLLKKCNICLFYFPSGGR